MSNEPDKIIYSMIRVTKRHGQKEVLKDISLSYFYGAKIGVLGLNGAGKSSLLRILAGVDQSFDGKTVRAPGYTIGYLAVSYTHLDVYKRQGMVCWREVNACLSPYGETAGNH